MRRRPKNGCVADLQFDRAEPLQGRPGLTCTNCGREIADSYFEVNGKVVCAPCRNVVEDQWNRGEGGSKARFAKALGLGLLATIGSAIVWYAVMELTNTQLGILAVGVGLAIGSAVSKGANARGGWRYQTLAIFLTYTAIVSSYAPFVIQGFKERMQEDASPSAQHATPTDSVVAPSTTAATAADGTSKKAAPSAGMIVVGLAALLLLFYATPVVVGIQNPILLFILGIALYEAWKLNKKAELRITGPYQAGRPAPA